MKFLRVLTKCIIYGLISIIVLVTGAGIYKYKSTPERIRPVPFNIPNNLYLENEVAELSDILIIGDNFAIDFNDQIEGMIESLSKGLKKPISIYNYATANEAIYRTIEKVKALKTLPPIVIYMGGSSEFAEDIYPPKLSNFWMNFKRYQDDYLNTLMIISPATSRLIYKKDEIKILNKEIIPFQFHGDLWYQRVSEATYFIYQDYLRDLIDLIQEKKAISLIITPPVNLQAEVKKACDNSVLDEITISQNEIKVLMDENKYKDAYRQIVALDKTAIGNARTKYLRGKAEFELGMFKEAKETLTLSKALECSPPRASVIINSIQKKIAQEKNVDIIKFDEIINSNFGKDVLFIDSEKPQFIYWEKLVNRLTIKLRGLLEL
ncbi:hypothetical protein [Bacteriovorax sp. Seq25_V]|uniref:hypothetical protein n=1 Tax=Bacteriovorax sp. Seq25_V TaxID=1201288 RepID=UPI00038A31E7|nr:hypothetical protein [Bacteriovorax sp. Seq25_V]EQC44915.1 hypothetical protein M900_A0117 [Bacteriovorax sp. Seq25_V]